MLLLLCKNFKAFLKTEGSLHFSSQHFLYLIWDFLLQKSDLYKETQK